MACHLSCPRCHGKFQKISNMSVRSFGKETFKAAQKSKKPMTIDDQDEALSLIDENAVLKAEIRNLAAKNDSLLQALSKNKEQFKKDFERLQNDIAYTEIHLLESSKRCLEQQKKFSEEIKELKQENETIKNEKLDMETSLAEKICSLESKIETLKVDNENSRFNSKENDQKCIKYKTKLKHAVKIVNELNEIVARYKNKSKNVSNTTQTDGVNTSEKEVMVDCLYSEAQMRHKTCDLNSENLILSDVFFRQKYFADSELDLFRVSRSKSRCSIREKYK